MISSGIELLVMINPFALFVYLNPVMDNLSNKAFRITLLKASMISLLIFLLFFIGGEYIFNSVLMIDYSSFRVFGGIVIFSYAYLFIVKGEKALITIKESLDDLASEIALPFMVGAGSITLAVRLGYNYSIIEGVLILSIVIIFNLFIILFMKTIKDIISRQRFKVAYDKNINILMRLNGFFIGAIGIDMILVGITNMFSKG